MRLIDADELINQGYEIVVDGLQYDTCNKSIDIDNIPTAYSVDKVVEELNKAKDKIANENYCRSINEKEKCDGRNCFKCCAEYLIEIVKQEAEKFGTDINVVSKGWIPCSERLPEESGYYLVTYHDWSDGNFLPKYDDTYVRRLHYQISDHFVGWNYPKNVDDRAENDCHKEVIAWQPLPEPFKECD